MTSKNEMSYLNRPTIKKSPKMKALTKEKGLGQGRG
jgi:hypothetical protein